MNNAVETIVDEQEVMKPHSIIKNNKRDEGMSNCIQLIGKYELSKEDECISPVSESPPNEKGSFADKAN